MKMTNGWKTTGTLHRRDMVTSIASWIIPIESPDGARNYKEINIRPYFPYHKRKNSKPIGYSVEDFLLGSRKQSLGFDTLKSFKTKAKALEFAKSWIRRHPKG